MSLFKRDTVGRSETAKYRVQYQASNPWFDTGRTEKTPWVRGYTAYEQTRRALRDSGYVVVGVQRRGR